VNSFCAEHISFYQEREHMFMHVLFVGFALYWALLWKQTFCVFSYLIMIWSFFISFSWD